jgi:hypothetical protein
MKLMGSIDLIGVRLRFPKTTNTDEFEFIRSFRATFRPFYVRFLIRFLSCSSTLFPPRNRILRPPLQGGFRFDNSRTCASDRLLHSKQYESGEWLDTHCSLILGQHTTIYERPAVFKVGIDSLGNRSELLHNTFGINRACN